MYRKLLKLSLLFSSLLCAEDVLNDNMSIGVELNPLRLLISDKNWLTVSGTIAHFNNSNGVEIAIPTTNPHKEPNNNPYYQGEVVTVEQAGAYTYLEVKEKTAKTFWVAVSSADVKVGDYVRFQMELVTKNFKSKALNKTFKEVMFASGLQYKVLKKENTKD